MFALSLPPIAPRPIAVPSMAPAPSSVPAPSASAPPPTAPGTAPLSGSDVPSEDVLIERAGRALREGRIDEALVACEQHARLYPGGALTSTRDPLWIAALLRAGRRAEASQRIERYAAAHPYDPRMSAFREPVAAP
jgi:hypothetical protein